MAVMTDAVVQQYLETFRDEGICSLPKLLNPADCQATLQQIKASRPFGPGIFMEEADFMADPQRWSVNPRPGRNLTEGMDLSYIETNPQLQPILARILGDQFTTVIKKVVCGVPSHWIPDWVRREIDNAPVKNLGAYVKPEYRDVTYFHGIDFHQDIIDYRGQPAQYVTLYIYIEDVTEADSPLVVIPKSHQLGATLFPHDLVHNPDGTWTYRDERGQELTLKHQPLLGGQGDVSFWHSCILHGTQPAQSPEGRLSLRYILQQDPHAPGAYMNEVNQSLRGPLALEVTRVDINEKAETVIRNNTINNVEVVEDGAP